MLKYLRIAVTALSLTACLLLVALWVRSYRWQDSVNARVPGKLDIIAWHLRGQIFFWVHDLRGLQVQFSTGPFYIAHESAAEFPVWETRFYYRESPNGTGFGCPYWFAVLTVAVAAVAPCIEYYRRFSLRTLLIATTLVAVGLGIVAMFS
jgi:hypothetical protein